MARPFYDDDDFLPTRGFRRTLHGGWGLLAPQTSGDGLIDTGPALPRRPICSETDPELFFPEKGQRQQVETARRICHLCPALTECRAQGDHEPYGVWGATTPRQRGKQRANETASLPPTNLDSMQVLGHINGISHHERHRPAASAVDYPTMTAEGRRKVISALTSLGWTTRSIAEALAIAESVITSDLTEIDIEVPDFPMPAAPAPATGKTHGTMLLEAYVAAPDGLTGPEAGRIAGLDHAAVSKRMSDLKKRKHITPLTDEHNTPVQRARATVYTITQQGRESLHAGLITSM